VKKTDRRSVTNWLTRYLELEAFVRLHDRLPDRHAPESKSERSLGWWLKDQRRKLRFGVKYRRKRGVLNQAQETLLRDLGIEPDFKISSAGVRRWLARERRARPRAVARAGGPRHYPAA